MKHVQTSILLSLIFIGFAFVIACGGQPAAPSNEAKVLAQSETPRPAWIEQSGSVGEEYIAVGSMDDAESEKEGMETASTDAKAELGRWIEQTVTSELTSMSESQESEEISKRQDTIKQTIQIESKQVLTGTVEKYKYWEKYQSGSDTFYRYYVAVAISKADFEKIRTAAERALAAVEKLEKEGLDLIRQGLIGPGLDKLIQAARDAILLKKYQSKFGTILTEIKGVLDRLSFEVVSGNNQTGDLQNGLPKPIQVKLVYTDEGGNKHAAKGTPVRVYVARDREEAFETIPTTDSNGMVNISVSRIQNSGTNLGRIFLDVKKSMADLLLTKVSDFRALAATLEKSIEDNGTEFKFTAKSGNRGKAVMILAESLFSGAPQGYFGREFASFLKDQAIDLTISPIKPNQYAGKSSQEIFNAEWTNFTEYEQIIIITVNFKAPRTLNVEAQVYNVADQAFLSSASDDSDRLGDKPAEAYEKVAKSLAKQLSTKLLKQWR